MKRTIQRIMSCLLAAVVCLTIFPNTISAAEGTETVGIDVTYYQSEARGMIDLINEFRAGDDAWYWNEDNDLQVSPDSLDSLTYDYGLEEIAMQRAAELAISYSHTRPNGELVVYSDWGDYTVYAENIAAGSILSSAEGAFELWREDDADYDGQGHRRAMLSSYYSAVGIACAYYNGAYYWVQVFGVSNSGASATDANNSTATIGVEVLVDSFAVSLASDAGSLALTLDGSISLPSITTLVGGASVTADITWEIEDTSIAEISDGSIIGLSLGETKLIATALGESVEFTITVQEVAAETNEETGTGDGSSSTETASGTTDTTTGTADTTAGTADTTTGTTDTTTGTADTTSDTTASTSDTTDTTSDASTNVVSAQTGDGTGMALWITLMLVSGFISIIAAVTLKKRV